jgi:hypothetical protein
VLDDNIPKRILTFLENKINFYIENVIPTKVFDEDRTVISNSYDVNKEYKQWYLQKQPFFTDWEDDEFELFTDYASQWFYDIREFKFSYTTPKTDISWHVLHNLPRAHIPLSDDGCLLDVVDTSQTMHTYKLEKGKFYLLNVCYPHRVRNKSNNSRKQAFFSFNKIKEYV